MQLVERIAPAWPLKEQADEGTISQVQHNEWMTALQKDEPNFVPP